MRQPPSPDWTQTTTPPDEQHEPSDLYEPDGLHDLGPQLLPGPDLPVAPEAEAMPPASPTRGGPSLSAADFTTQRYVRPQVAAYGWRRWVCRLSGGLVNPGPSAAERAEQELLGVATTPIQGCRRVAVLSRKGGVGKTTTVVMLGHTFASVRGDRVVALDGNPDAGSLGYRIRRETTNTITDLLRDEPKIRRYADIRAYTSQAPTRLEVLASDDDPRITEALGEGDYRRVIRKLEDYYNLIMLDSGTGILESATKGILQEADQLVVVLAPGVDSARGAAATLDWLEQQGLARLVGGAVAVINHAVQATSALELDRIHQHFAERCQAVVEVPWDAHLATGAETATEQLRRDTRQAYLRLAAAVAAGFALERPG